MKTILHIVQGKKGGTSEYIKMLINNLDKNKYNNIVICHGEIYDDLKKNNIKVFNVKMVRNPSLFDDLKALFKINKFVRKNKIDLIYAHSSKAGALGRFVAKINHIKCIYNAHGWSFNMKVNKYKIKIYELFEKIAANWADKIIVISQSEYNDALKRNICSKDKLVLINNGIQLEKYDFKKNILFKQKIRIDLNKKVIGMCCRLTEQKNPLMFIKIAKLVTDKYDNCIFLLVGDGILKNKVISTIKNYGLENKVILTGWTDNQEDYINIFDIGVLTSRWEGFGLSLVEYMACGRPVVASNVDGIPYVIRNEVDGLLCNPNDANDFADNIIELLNDNNLYNIMSKNALDRSKKFDIKEVSKKHELLFNSLL